MSEFHYREMTLNTSIILFQQNNRSHRFGLHHDHDTCSLF